MLKQLLYFGNPARLSLQHDQLRIERAGEETLTRPLEGIGSMVIDHGEVSLTTPLISRAAGMGVLLVFTDAQHLPVAYTTSMVGHHLQNLRHRQQLAATPARLRQAWAQLVRAKLRNQATVLEAHGHAPTRLHYLAEHVQSGDPDNQEAHGARHYWGQLFGQDPDFYRDRYGPPPNHLLNYGYAILRAATARALAGAGLCVALGIFHHHRGDQHPLADDMMEPFRPWVDHCVLGMGERMLIPELDRPAKAALLQVLHHDTRMGRQDSPLMVALDTAAASLAAFFAGETDTLRLPAFPHARTRL